MTLTMLLDLDDTLLNNDMETFLPAYLQKLSGSMTSYAHPEDFVEKLLFATKHMLANDRPDRTLKETFDEVFYPALGMKVEDLREKIDAFYSEVFPKLQSLSSPKPEAIKLVEKATKRGYRVVIATNPLFPRQAIFERLRWAGLSPGDYELGLVTSYETFHYAKPNPAYYAEIMARLGWQDNPVIMVGDDLENDIIPARQLGLPTFWVAKESAKATNDGKPHTSGKLEDVLPWIDSISLENLQPSYNGSDALLAILKSTPAAISSLVSDLPQSSWTQRPDTKEWCVAEILCHLRDVEAEVNLPRLRKVLREDNPFIPGMDTDPWAEERQYICQDGRRALDEFMSFRIESLEILKNADAKDWSRPARHAIFGPTKLVELVNITTAHDRLHVRQFFQVLAMISPQETDLVH